MVETSTRYRFGGRIRAKKLNGHVDHLINPKESHAFTAAFLSRFIQEQEMTTPTPNAPTSFDELKTLLENDTKVKVAGTLALLMFDKVDIV